METSSDPIKLVRDETSSDPLKEFYKETLDLSITTCDLIIKVGPQGIEHHCHRVVLASASKFLRNALKTTEFGKLPVLILPDLSSDVFKYVLSYVYNGEVRVPHEMQGEFLDACQLLKIKGVKEDDVETMEVIENSLKEGTAIKQERELIIEDENAFFEGDLTYNDEKRNESGTIGNISNPWTYNTQSEEQESNYEDDVVCISDDFDHYEDPRYNHSPTNFNNASSSRNYHDPKKPMRLVYEKIKLTKTTKVYHEMQVKEHIRNIYERLDTKPDIDLESAVNKTKLLIENKILLSASHACAFCEKVFITYYTRYNKVKIRWNSAILRNHLKNAHNLNFTSVGSSRSTKATIEIESDAMRIYYENEAKKTVRDIYELLNLKPEGNFEQIVNNTELIIEAGTLIRARHSCGFCKRFSILTYSQESGSNSITWSNINLRNHLVSQHYKNGPEKYM